MTDLPTIAQLRQLHRENRAWPVTLKDIPGPWPHIPFDVATGSTVKRVLRSRAFLCVVWDQGGTMRLSIQRTEYDLRTRHPRDGIAWDDLQRLKGEAGFADRVAVEIYPPSDKVVNVANIRHLFVTDAPEFMW